MILSPYFWLALLVWTAIVGASSYYKGHTNAENAARAAHATALEETIKQSREDAVIDMTAAVEAEQERQKTRVEFKDRIVTVERLVNANKFPDECKLSEPTVQLFNDAINAVNSKTATKHEPVQPAPVTPNRKPTGISASLDSNY